MFRTMTPAIVVGIGTSGYTETFKIPGPADDFASEYMPLGHNTAIEIAKFKNCSIFATN